MNVTIAVEMVEQNLYRCHIDEPVLCRPLTLIFLLCFCSILLVSGGDQCRHRYTHPHYCSIGAADAVPNKEGWPFPVVNPLNGASVTYDIVAYSWDYLPACICIIRNSPPSPLRPRKGYRSHRSIIYHHGWDGHLFQSKRLSSTSPKKS